MTKEELNKIIENHKHWLNQDCEGWVKMKADLSIADLDNADLCKADLRNADLDNADLCKADLRNANLYGADLQNANLQYANLRGADLRGADLRYAYLRFADLRQADLRYAYLRDADLRNANLHNADLRCANLRCANLNDTNLHDADLSDAILRGADLSDANLYGAKLYYADLRDAKNIPFIPYTCPDTGSFIGYKKARNKIIKLEIPEDAKRISGMTRKCRCNKAKVLGIYDYNHNLLEDKEVASDMDKNFIYRVGEFVEVKNFDEDRWHECSTGIHFFVNFEEAVNY